MREGSRAEAREESNPEQDHLSHYHRGLVGDDRHDSLASGNLWPKQVSLDRLATDRRGGSARVDRLAGQTGGEKVKERPWRPRQREAPAEGVEDHHDPRREHQDDEHSPRQAPEGLPHHVRTDVPNQIAHDGQSETKEQWAGSGPDRSARPGPPRRYWTLTE